MVRFALFAAWAALAGALIPVMALLNVRLGRTLGAPVHVPVLFFGVGLCASLIASLLFGGGLPDLRLLAKGSLSDLGGGLIMMSYIVMVTLLAPRQGISTVILFAVSAQVLTAATIDRFGLLGSATRELSTARLLGIGFVLAGLVLSQSANALNSATGNQ